MPCAGSLDDPRCRGCSGQRFGGDLVSELGGCLRKNGGGDAEAAKGVSTDEVDIAVDCQVKVE